MHLALRRSGDQIGRNTVQRHEAVPKEKLRSNSLRQSREPRAGLRPVTQRNTNIRDGVVRGRSRDIQIQRECTPRKGTGRRVSHVPFPDYSSIHCALARRVVTYPVAEAMLARDAVSE